MQDLTMDLFYLQVQYDYDLDYNPHLNQKKKEDCLDAMSINNRRQSYYQVESKYLY